MSLNELPRDKRGLPVPTVAAWSSEHWASTRMDPCAGGRWALFTAGRQGRGRPCFDVVNEPRQRRALHLARCQVCDDPLPRGTNGAFGYLPASTLTVESHGRLEDGTPVTHEPLCCGPCAEYVTERCCHLRRHGAGLLLIRLCDVQRIMQFIDPLAGPPLHAAQFDREPTERERATLARMVKREGGLVGFVKLALREVVEL